MNYAIIPRDNKILGYFVQLDNSIMSNLEFHSIIPCKSPRTPFLPNLIISLSRSQIIYQLILRFLLLSSTPSTTDVLRPKNLTSLLIINNFYITRLIRLIHIFLILYSLLKSPKEPLAILRLIRNQHVNKTEYESIKVHS